jgi:PAS domain S-box-containing protein
MVRMDPSLRSQLEMLLLQRCQAVAERWQRAIAQTSYVALDATQAGHELADLTRRAAMLLIAEPFDRDKPQEIGAAVARLHYLQPDALGQTIGILASCFSEGLSAEQSAVLQPRLTALLDGVATGFWRQASEMILAEQESIRAALVSALQTTEKALRAAHDELELRVRERTSQLARANEELRSEIAERRRAEEALRASEERWRTLVENAPDLVLTVDRAARILFVNRVLLGTGLTPDDYIGRDVSEYAMTEARELTRQAIERVFVEESDGYFEARGRLSNGRVAWYATRLAPVRQDGTVVAVMMIARDITDRKEIDEMKDNLIRDVSHELRTPLAKMQMSMELLLEILGKEPINRQRAIGIGHMVFGNTRRLLQTVEAILDLSALEAGRVVYDKIKFLPADLMNEMLQYMRPMAEAKRLELVVRVQEDLPTVEGDLDKLTRVMINLIDNAIKFSDRGQIVLWAQRNGQEVEFAVSDNGYGVLKENLERIFEKFYQERISISGAGVGLPICKTIVEAHGGAIWAESPGRGQGTTVRFTLPTRVNGEE